MQRRPLLWFLLSLLLFAGAAIFWQLGERWAGRASTATPPAPRPRPAALDATPSRLRHSENFRLLSASAPATPAAARSAASLRLTNARFTPAEWLRRPTAVLLENALIDTATSGRLDVPAHLRAPGDPGAYIVQARGRIDEAFRATIRGAGANIVAYIPNNAYLVRASRQVADQLAGRPAVQAVLPYEPYYKLRTDLLRLAVEQAALPLGERLNMALFEDAREATLAALRGLGAQVLAEERSPFGPVLTVQPPPESLVALAALPGVQVIEPALERVPANDLSRVRLGVAADTQVTDNWLGLTGTNVLVNVNDSGVDSTHPDLVGRMFALATNELADPNGHGTHVIGSVAGNGAMSATVSNASGSEVPAVTGQFRGAAPGASVFVQPVLQENRPGRAAAGRVLPDSLLQETAARTNAFVSNNSWHYAGNSGYDLAAARFDAATRDALPDTPGSQPLLFVFAAGNAGRGNNAGLGGDADSVRSPGTAKNVITVGAIEQPRDITNEVTICRSTDTGTNVMTLCETNQPWKGETDTDDQVLAVSGRGNTGVGIEGEQGRYKPDVVAPGAWVISTRSQQWDEQAYYNPTNSYAELYTDLVVEPGGLNQYSIFVPYNAVQLVIDTLPNAASPVPFPGLMICVRSDGFATTNDFVNTNHVALPPDLGPNLAPRDTVWSFAIGNTTTGAVSFNLRTEILTTNDLGNELEVRSNLNNTLGPWYRYESGSSMAAAHVAGTLALMQEFLEQRLGRTNSPALMKALLINGARSLGPLYDFQVRTLHNYQGWGRVNLPTALPGALSNAFSRTTGPILVYDQDPNHALATGDRHIRQLKISDAARTVPLRITLVWTDPPGNPAAGVKLVNDLDLVVTNLDTGEVFFGNDIVAGSDFTQPWPTNDLPNIDVVNNVENVFLSPLLGTNYTVTVIGSHVNVNAVTAHTNNTVQDYALVITSGDGDLEDALTITELPGFSLSGAEVRQFTNTFSAANTPGYNGTLLMGEHVGANTPLMGITNGMTNQWRFYVLTNTENYTNAAFVTFLPWTLSIPRLGVNEDRLANATRAEADIDLYVSLDPNLTNLSPAALAAADKSRGRGGTEVLVYSNALPGAVYYVGVKAEDQMASEFGFLGVFSLLPFSEDDNGAEVLRGFPAPVLIPDGSPSAPGAGLVFALSVRPTEVRRVVVTNTITHENFGDLVGSLHHNTVFAVLNNHNFPYLPPPLTATTIYEDNGENDIPGAQRTAGPGSLRDFVGERAVGLWLLQMLDDALTQTGRVDGLTIRLEPQLIGDTNAWRAVQPYSFIYDFVNVPAGATNLTVCVYTTNAPVELYIRRGAFPSRTEYDKKMTIPVPGACMTVDLSDLPPLTEGRYYIGVYNPNPVVQYVRIVVTLEIDPRGRAPVIYADNSPLTLQDDAVTYATQFVTNRGRIATVEVGLRVDHPRVSDLAVTLISPRGTRILLTENRGWTNGAGFGSTYWITNVVPQDSSGGPAAYTNVIDTGSTYGTVTIDYEFYSIPDQLRVYYEGQLIFDTGMVTGGDVVTVPYGPGASTQITVTMNEGNNPEPDTLWRYTVSAVQQVHNHLVFTENTDLTTTPIKFTPPPFAPPSTYSVQLLSDFESAPPGDYVAPQTVDGWTVLSTNPVTVLNDPAAAHAGAQFLALRSGEIFRMLPTLPGRNYRLDFAYRGDLYLINVDFNSVTYGSPSPKTGLAAVGQTTNDFWNLYNRNGPGNVWRHNGAVPNLLQADGLPTDVGLTVWNAMGAWGNGSQDPMYLVYLYPLPNGPGHVRVEITNLPPASYDFYVYSHNGNYELTAGGVSYGVATTTDPAPSGRLPQWTEGVQYARFRNVAVTNAAQPVLITARPSLTDVAMIAGLQIERLAKPRCAVSVGGKVTNNFAGTHAWQTNSLFFTATSTNIPLGVFASGEDSKTFLDTFVLTELPGSMYALPEESLKALVDENPYGQWTLEILDTRADSTNLLPALLSWQLRFVFQNDVPTPGILLPGVARTNTIPPGMFAYYVVDVPAWANFATNTLLDATSPLNLWFNQTTPPFGTNTGDFLLLNQVTSGQATLSAASAPPLQPGRRYYLGVQNTNATTVTYALQVDFDITPLANGVPVTSLSDPGMPPRYFSFDVSDAATVAWFALTNLSGNVNLVVSKGPNLPTLADFDYGSFNSGSLDEEVVVLTNSTPVALSPGRWYLAVYNADVSTVVYTVVAAEYAFTAPIITLTNGVPYTNAVAAGGRDYYRYTVSPAAARAQFEVNGPGEDLTLLARKGWPPPDFASYDYLSANPGTNDEYLLLFNDSQPVALTPGDWFLTVANNSAAAAGYAVKATEWPVTGQPIVIVSVGTAGTNFCLAWTSLPGAHYYVQGLTDLETGVWTTVSPTLTAADVLTTWCLPRTSPYHFFRVVEGIAVGP